MLPNCAKPAAKRRSYRIRHSWARDGKAILASVLFLSVSGSAEVAEDGEMFLRNFFFLGYDK